MRKNLTKVFFYEIIMVLHGAYSNDGVIVLQPYGNKEDVEALVNELNQLDGITARYLDLN